MRKDNPDPAPVLSRRAFFKSAAVGASGAFALGATAANAASAPNAAPPPHGGYRETAHIRRYYGLARQI